MLQMSEEQLKTNLSRNLRYLRLGKPGMSQKVLARKIGTTCKSISRYETGICLPPCHLLHALGCYFGYTMDELVADKLPSRKGRETNE